MKLPKTIKICGITYEIRKNKTKCWFGETTTGNQVIKIGAKYNKAERMFENLLHEVAETALGERMKRYASGEDNSCVIFVLTHNDFEIFAQDLAAALLPMIKE